MKTFKESLSKQAFLGIIIILLPILITFFLSYNQNKAQTKKRVLDDLTVIAEAYEGQVYLFLEKLKRCTEDFASDGLIRTHLLRKMSGKESAVDTLSKHLVENKLPLSNTIKTIHVLSLDGHVIASTNRSEIGRDLSNEPFFRKDKVATTVTENYAGHAGLPEIEISSPILSNRRGKPIGVIVNFIQISELNKILSGEYTKNLGALSQIKAGTWKTMEVYLVNSNKRMITESKFIKDAVLRQVVDTLPVAAGLTSNKEMAGFYKDYRGIEVLGASMFIPSLKWTLIAEIDKNEVLAPVKSMLINAVITSAVVIGMVVLLFLAFLKKVVKPLHMISDAAKDIAHGNFNIVIPVTTRNETGTLCELFNTMSHDIKAGTAALRESESRLQSILDNAPAAIYVKDIQGRFIFINRQFENLFHVERNTIKGKTDHDLWAGEMADVFRANDLKVIEAKSPLEFDEVAPDGDGALHTYISVKFPLIDSRGKVYAVCGISTDITERKRTEETLRKSESKYRTLLENLPQKIFYKNKNLTYVSCNGNYARDLKITPNEIAGKTDYDFYPRELAEKYRADDKRIMELEQTEDIEEKYVNEGREMIVRMVKTPIKDESGAIAGILGIFWDITRFKRAEDERQELREQLYHMQRLESIGTLAGGVAHDFNNILALIMGYGSLLEKEMGDDDSLKGYVQKILTAAEKAANLTHNLLAFSRKQVTNPKPVQVNEIIKRIECFLPRLIGENIRLKTALTDKDCVVMANSSQIEQVLMNLVTNARDAMPDGGLMSISTDVVALGNDYREKHGLCDDGMYALLSVSDTGVGMDDQTKERIFEPFFTTKEVGKGTGLGLAIVYGIVKQHKGYINVYSQHGKGTTFKIYLPITESVTEERKPEAFSNPVGGTETILLAEDEAEVIELAKTVFEEYGYKVIKASDGEDTIDKFMKNKDTIQCLVLDVRMPRKNGKEVYDAIKKIKPDIKALFMSGYSKDIINKKDIFEEGLTFVSKPVLPTELLRKVREVLDVGKREGSI